ncbi:MAG TPA: metal ABC transporter permease [Fimbriimonadaceae bacterium]|nr:metal ABC transporter permease [Fimbriimonadaceae bacterium]
MSGALAIALVAIVAGASCGLAGVFLVLRRLAMMSDAISHAILPGLVAGYFFARGPNLIAAFLGATAAGVLTVFLVETIVRMRRLKEDAAIGLVFPALFAIGVLLVSRYFANVHLDTDAVLYGEIALAPFDTWNVAGRNLGPQSLWVLAGLGLLNAGFLYLFFKELKLSTFDPGLAEILGFRPGLLHYSFMTIIAMTTVGAFSAVGAILAVALIVIPAVTASFWTTRLPVVIVLSIGIGAFAGLLGYGAATAIDVSISGAIATTLGLLVGGSALFAPRTGFVAQALLRRRQRWAFAATALVIHLAHHRGTDAEVEESRLDHLQAELGWSSDEVNRIVRESEEAGWTIREGDRLVLTETGARAAAGRLVADRA